MQLPRPVTGLLAMLVLLGAGCGDSSTASLPGSPDTAPGVPIEAPTLLRDDASVPTVIGGPTPVATPTAPLVTSAAVSVSTPAVPSASESAAPVDTARLFEAAKNSPFHQFGDGVYSWDDKRRIVVHQVPVGHRALDALRERLGHRHGNIEDTSTTRSWVQSCARRISEPALGAPDAVYGEIAAQGVFSCLGGLAHLTELLARYWWTGAGAACVADSAMDHSHRGDALPRPLAICPSVGYDPTAPRPAGWLAQRCAEIVAANPNPNYPADPAQLVEPLPSCWHPLTEIIEAHAAERVDIGLPDSPHDCFHAYLGYVWARQTGRESRPPSSLAIGCDYSAFEAIP